MAPAASCYHHNPSPVLAPIGASRRHKIVNFYRYAKTSLLHSGNSLVTLPRQSSSTSSQGADKELCLRVSAVKPLKHLAATSSTFLVCDQGLSCTNPLLPRQHGSSVLVRAYKDNFFKFRIPLITAKPEWWWRTLSCVPYLIALQISDTGYYIQPFLERHEILEDLVFFVPGAIRRLPIFFPMFYCYFAYIWIVKNKDLPHFFRFHMMMGLLLETAMQIIWYTSNFFPLIHYSGKFGVYYWAAMGFAYIFVLLECVRCALGGMYSHIPLVSEAAFIHTLFNMGGFQRPF